MIDSFWQTRDSLEHVLSLARARGAGPWAVLGSTLVRTVAMIPPDITLPGIVGSRMSLNLFVALVGHSGAGKGAAAAAAAAADGHHFPMNVDAVPLGTGEGIARTYRPIGTSAAEPDPTTAIFDAPEIDTVAALAARQGGTLSAELRKLYSGEQLGFGNAGKETRVIVPAHSYRACLSMVCNHCDPTRSSAPQMADYRRGSCGYPPPTRTHPTMHQKIPAAGKCPDRPGSVPSTAGST